MKKKLALLVYPTFSLQEIGNTVALFRWYFDTPTVVFASSDQPVTSEEGITVLPDKTVDAFDPDAYDALILPGVSDVRASLKDEKLMRFLRRLKAHPDLIIGALCGGPIFLSMAGLLDDKKFINQLYVEMNERLPFIRQENLTYRPIVVDGNIVTAVAEAYADFPVVLARMMGYTCPEDAYKPHVDAEASEDAYKFYLDDEGLRMFEEAFADFL